MGFKDWLKAISVPTFQLLDNDIVVFVVGPSGAGKSLFVERVTRSGLVKTTKNLPPCTTNVQAIRCELTDEAKTTLGTVAVEKNIVFVDTPSFHTGQNDLDRAAKEELKSWLSNSKSKSTLVGTIYMHRVETDPTYESIQDHLNTFAYAFPPDFPYFPQRLHAVLSYEGKISEGTIIPRMETFRMQLRALHPSPRLGGQLRWDFSFHPDLFYQDDPETAWQAVVALFRLPPRPQSPFVPRAVKVVSYGPVHVGAPRTRRPVMAVSNQTNAKPSFNFAVTNNPANDLTNKITRDGNDPVASGGFADIYRGMLQQNGELTKMRFSFMINEIISTYRYHRSLSKQSRHIRRLRREIKVWLNLRHDNVLPLLGTTTGFGRFPAMVSPWVENGTLTSYLNGCYDNLSVIGILGLLNDVASGLQYLHSRSVVHGDLSGSNVLIRENGRAYITDFGLSMLLTELGGLTFVTSFQARGTLRWTAPELLDLEIPEDDMEDESPRTAPTMHSDVYSLGGVMLQILSGNIPYHYYTREGQVVHAVSKGMTPKRPSTALVTDDRWRFMQRCWFTAERRPLSEEIVEFAEKELAGASAPQH